MDKTMPKDSMSTAAAAHKQVDQELPPLSAQDFRLFNSVAVHMNMFHDVFRRTWNMLYGACEANKRPNHMSIRAFISEGERFCQHLTGHHTFEERNVFPRLALKMPAFRKELELLTQHKLIHEGLERLEAYLVECKRGQRELRMSELKGVMDTFGAVLWQHLDEEVNELRAENMRKYWSREEMAQFGV
jgi:hemerythrin-like domain-containing protein